jgi:hypothetical protein
MDRLQEEDFMGAFGADITANDAKVPYAIYNKLISSFYRPSCYVFPYQGLGSVIFDPANDHLEIKI